MAEPIIVLCTFPDLALAESVAKTLVSEGLAACLSLQPKLVSIYQWEGKLCREEEVLALIKTHASGFDALEARILELHSYTCPEIVALPITEGHAPYLAWLGQQIQPPSAP